MNKIQKKLAIFTSIAFIAEGIGFLLSLAGANTYLCWIPPASTYNGFRISGIFSLMGASFLSFSLMQEQLDNILTQSRIDKSATKTYFYLVNSDPLILLLFHNSFIIEIFNHSIGCNGIPKGLLTLIFIPWVVPAFIILCKKIKQLKFLSIFFIGYFVILIISVLRVFPSLFGNFSDYDVIANYRSFFRIVEYINIGWWVLLLAVNSIINFVELGRSVN